MIQSQQLRKESDILEKIDNLIVKTKQNIYLFNLLLPVIKENQGKIISKRLANQYEKLLGNDYYVTYSTQYGMYHIKARHKLDDYANTSEFSALVGYQGTQDIIDYESFLKHNVCYSLESIRLEKYEKSKSHIKDLVSRFNQGVRILQDVNAEASEYEIEYQGFD